MTPNLRRDLAEIVTPTSASSQLTLLEVSSLGGKGKGKNSPYSFMVCEKKCILQVRSTSILKVVSTPQFSGDLAANLIHSSSRPLLPSLKTASSNSTRKWPIQAPENRPRRAAARRDFGNSGNAKFSHQDRHIYRDSTSGYPLHALQSASSNSNAKWLVNAIKPHPRASAPSTNFND